MPDCSVTIQNNSGRPQTYIFFADAPQVKGAGNISQCVFAIAQRVQDGDSKQVRVNTGNYAISCNKNGEDVYVQDQRPIRLADEHRNGGSVISFDGDREREGSVSPGCFEIRTQGGGRGQTIGLGAEGERGVAPLAIWDADDGVIYEIRPSTKFRIAVGGDDYRAGSVVDGRQFGREAREIDFTKQSVSFTQGPDGGITGS